MQTTLFIPHPRRLLEGRFLARYDRFIATVALKDRTVEAHCVNPGRMEGLIRPGCRAWVSEAPAGSKRKLLYTLELMEIDGIYIGVNTILPNLLAERLISERLIPGLKRFQTLRREVRYGDHSRIDILLEGRGRPHLVEVKNCHLVYPDGGAYFPDSVSARAAGHLQALVAQVAEGKRATVLFVLQRRDGRLVRPSQLHDPTFAQAAQKASKAGVRFRAVQLDPRPEGFTYLGTLPVDVRPYDSTPLAPYREALKDTSGWQRRGRQVIPSSR
ncbi:MAG: sugar fermentation stimulation protein A [Halieaceae bacterium]|jgi:sugar fermentation stimulation protein A